MLEQAGWKVQPRKKIDFNAGPGIAVREYDTDVGPADYVLFVNKQAVGVIEAKPENWGQKITTVEDQSQGYAAAELKWVKNNAPLPFVYESTGAALDCAVEKEHCGHVVYSDLDDDRCSISATIHYNAFYNIRPAKVLLTA
jgi:type I site-specific restriction endonuclease